MKNQNKIIENFFLLDITDTTGEVIRTIEITSDEVYIMRELITDISENRTGGITIRLKLKTNYSI
jgi:hypothetical protein